MKMKVGKKSTQLAVIVSRRQMQWDASIALLSLIRLFKSQVQLCYYNDIARYIYIRNK